MGLVEQSKNAGEVLRGSLAGSQVKLARYRLEVDVAHELVALGADASPDAVRKIIDGLPSEVLVAELARRT